MTGRLAYLGPPGTFSEEAALKFDSRAELVPMSSITAVATAVDSGMADWGILPIENSLEGSVPETLDVLVHNPRPLFSAASITAFGKQRSTNPRHCPSACG